MAKFNQNSIIEPSEEELAVYNQFVNDITNEQMDVFANKYFELVQAEKINVSFPKYLIDQIIRPISEGDTIAFEDTEGTKHMLFCILRKEIEGKTYLAFCKVEEETETLIHDTTYLFFVDGTDNIGMEMIDIIPAGEESQRILELMEADLIVTENNQPSTEEEKQE